MELLFRLLSSSSSLLLMLLLLLLLLLPLFLVPPSPSLFLRPRPCSCPFCSVFLPLMVLLSSPGFYFLFAIENFLLASLALSYQDRDMTLEFPNEEIILVSCCSGWRNIRPSIFGVLLL